MKFIKDFINDFLEILIKKINFHYLEKNLFLINFKRNAHSFFLRNIDKVSFLSKLKIFINDNLNNKVIFVNNDFIKHYQICVYKKNDNFRIKRSVDF